MNGETPDRSGTFGTWKNFGKIFFSAKMKVVQNHLKREKNQKKIFPLWLAETLVKFSTVGSRPVGVRSEPG